MFFHPEGQGLDPCDREEGVDRRHGRPKVSKRHGVGESGIGKVPKRLLEREAVVSGLRL